MAVILEDYLCYTENHLRVLHQCSVAMQSIKNCFQAPTQIGSTMIRELPGLDILFPFLLASSKLAI